MPLSWIYASTIAYIVDANNGRSSTAVAANSAFRGLFAFVATEIAVPLQVATSSPIYKTHADSHALNQDAVGDGQ